MRPLQPDKALSAIVGNKPLPRTEIVKKLWSYIKTNNLQDSHNKRMINADDKLRALFGGKKQVSMFEMTKLVTQHLDAGAVGLPASSSSATERQGVGSGQDTQIPSLRKEDEKGSNLQSVLASGDGSIERPFKVKSIQEEHAILRHFEKELSMQGFMPQESLDQMVCKDGSVYYFDISQAKAGRRMTTKSGNPVIDRELDKLEDLNSHLESIDQAIAEKHSYRGLPICPQCNGALSDHLYGIWECRQCNITVGVKDLKRADTARAWGKIVGIVLLIAFFVGLAKFLGN